MEAIFKDILVSLENENQSRDAIKTQVKELETQLRSLQGSIGQIHVNPSSGPTVVSNLKQAIPAFHACFAQLQSCVPSDQYYKHCNMWKNAIQQVVFMLALMTWLENGSLITLTEAETLLGLPGKVSGSAAWAIELEDYLAGVASLPSEMSRLCMNAVIHEDYALPKRIQAFVAELYDAFRLINCKNDFLRKKVDGIKYELKKIEEIEYDIRIRKLRVD